MAGWLDYGAGAASGLEALLERKLKEQVAAQHQQSIDETVRSNRADEGYRDRALIESSALRRQTAGDLAKTRADQEANRQTDNIRARIALRPIDSPVPQDEYDEDRNVGKAPDALYSVTATSRQAGDEDYGPVQDIKYKGTEGQQVARLRANKKPAEPQGTVRETSNGLVRVMPDGTTKPVVDTNGKQARGYHPPPQPISVITVDADGNPVTRVVDKKVGSEFQRPAPQGIQSRMYTSRGVLSHMGEVKDELDEAERRGLLGPIEGRWADFLAGKVGSTGDSANDELLGQMRMDLKLLTSGTVAAHFQSRGGQQMMHDFQALLDSGKFSRDELRGSINSMETWLKAYAGNPAKLGVGDTPSSTTDPYAEYLKRKKK